MGKRKDAARASDSTGQTNKTGRPDKVEKPDALENSVTPPVDVLPGIPSPDLVPADVPPASVSAEAEAIEPHLDPIDPPADLAFTPAAADVITVSFAQAAADATAHGDPPARRSAAIAAYLRARRFLPLAATVAIAAAVGTLVGALGSTEMSRLIASNDAPASGNLAATMARIGTDIAALKANADISAHATSAQFARLSERLDHADRAQAEATGKIAKLTDSLDHHVAVVPTATTDRLVTGSLPANPPPQLAAPATRPAGQPIVEGWALRSVANGAAVIQGRIGLVEVEPGDSLPGLGRIEDIRRLDGRWVVVTNRGLIIAR